MKFLAKCVDVSLLTHTDAFYIYVTKDKKEEIKTRKYVACGDTAGVEKMGLIIVHQLCTLEIQYRLLLRAEKNTIKSLYTLSPSPICCINI